MGILTRKVKAVRENAGGWLGMAKGESRCRSELKIAQESGSRNGLREKMGSQVVFNRKRLKSSMESIQSNSTSTRDIQFKFNKPTLPNILTSPLTVGRSTPQYSTVQALSEPIHTLLKTLISDSAMERTRGIPNPDKYNAKAVNDLMPSKKFLVVHSLNEEKRTKNYQSLFKLHCPYQRTGVSGTKIIKNKVPKLHKEMCTSLSPFKSQIQARRLRNWEVYQKTVLLKSSKVLEKHSATSDNHCKAPEHILQIKSGYWPFKEKGKLASCAEKKKIVVNLNCCNYVVGIVTVG
eukprot:TRINITY_DN6836_c0_g1_i9.p1 TRINITY_DN6836_c0_g1~~TRINITY_DN6836_c0_g1_i9.p1  ORF type:complete len:292 (+),score=64.87 TRINITY_DN6836_c0_g1_i9:128-1003(+)